MTKTFLLLALGLLAGSALGQVTGDPGGAGGTGGSGGTGSGGGTGGGGGTNPPQSGWVLQFKGIVYDHDGNVIWSRSQYAARGGDGTREVQWDFGPDHDAYGIGAGDTADVHGTISVRRHWVGSGTPTAGQNFRIRSYASALSVYSATAGANNGFGGKIGNPVVVDDLKLIQPGDSDGDTVIAFTTSGEKAGFFVGAEFDGRYVRADYDSFRKGAQISTTTFEFTVTDGTKRTWTVPTYERIHNEPAFSGGNATVRADVGLPLMSYRVGPTETVLTSVPFVGTAAWAQPGMPWSFTISPDLYGSSTSGVHQSNDPLSVTLSAVVERPQVRTTKEGGKLVVDYLPGDSEKSPDVTFKASWPDGLEGQGVVNANFHPEAKHVRSFPTFGDPDKEDPVDQLTSDGEDHVSYQTDAYETGGTQGNVAFKLFGGALTGISIALSAWQPEGLPYVVALAAAGKLLDAAGPWAEPEKFTYNRNIDVLNPEVMIPGTVYTSYDWIGTIRPETLYTPHEVERYTLSGYLFNDLVLQTQVDPTRGKRAIRLAGRPH